MRRILIASICILASMLLGTQAYAQCPAGTDPLQALVGSWSYQVTGLNFASAGTFTASVGAADPRVPSFIVGLVNFTASSNNNGIVVRQERDTGRYQIFPDCSGGTITLGITSHPVTFDFWFIEGRTEFYMVSIDNLILPSAWVPSGVGLVVSGEASRT